MSVREYVAHEWPVCPTCNGQMERIWLARGEPAQKFAPIVYHESADGRMRFPGTADAPMPQGFVRKEVRTFREYEQFSRRVNRIERSKIEQMTEVDHMHAEVIERERGNLWAALQSASPAARDFARAAIDYSNNHRMRSADPNFHCEVMEFDQGSREPERDARTGWRARHR